MIAKNINILRGSEIYRFGEHGIRLPSDRNLPPVSYCLHTFRSLLSPRRITIHLIKLNVPAMQFNYLRNTPEPADIFIIIMISIN